MFDTKKYKEQINKVLSFAEEFHYVTESYICEIFEIDKSVLLDEIK